jgi:hypothetical protein
MKNKSIKQTKKEVAKSKLPHMAIHGAFLVVREARLSWT